MKIAFLAPMIDYSGAPKMMIWLANSFAEKKYDITLITYNGPPKNQEINPRIECKCMGIPLASNWWKRNTIDLFQTVYSTIKFIQKNKINIIISFTDNVSIVLLLLRKCLKAKFFISERLDPYTNTGKLDCLRRKCFYYADAVIFQTEQARDYFPEKIKHKSVVIPNPVISNVKYEKSVQRNNCIVSVGRLDISQKRQDLLIDAFSMMVKNHFDINLVIYGDGKDKSLLLEQIEKLDLSSRITLAGVTNNVYEDIKDARLFVLSSDYEGIPNSLIEAMSMGVPVISTDCSPGGAKFLINNYENGIIVPRNNKEELKNAMDYMISHRKEAEAMAEKAMEITKRLDEKVIFYQWESLVNV